MKEAILYELLESFEYAVKGEMQTVNFIELRPPTARNLKECSALKQAFFRALPDGDSSEVKDDPADVGDIAGSDVIALIMRSENVELNTVLLNARQLFISNIGYIEGEQKLTAPLADLISLDDLENMTGEYLINFILASILPKLNQK